MSKHSKTAELSSGKKFWSLVAVSVYVAIWTQTAQGSPDRSQVEAYSGDGNSIVAAVLHDEPAAIGYSEQLEVWEVWDVKTGKSRFRLPKVINQATLEAALSPNGRYLAVGRYGPQSQSNWRPQNNRGEWSLWDVNEKRLIRQAVVDYGWVGQVAFSPDGQQFALASQHVNSTGQYDRTQIWMVESTTGKTLRTYLPGWSAMSSVVFSPDGQTLGICGEMRPGRFINTSSQPSLGIVQLWDANAERLLRTFVEVDCTVVDLTFSRQGDRIVYRRNLEKRSELDASLSSLGGDPSPQKPPSAQGSLLEMPVAPVTALGLAQVDSERDMVMWNLRTGQCVLWRGGSKAPGIEVEIDRPRFSFSPDGRTLSCLMRSNTPDPNYPANSGYIETRWVVRSWELADTIFNDPAPVPRSTTIPMQESRLIDRPRFSPDGQCVVAPSLETQIYFWDSNSGKLSGKTWVLTHP